MRKVSKIMLLTATLLLLFGMALLACAGYISDLDYTKFGTVKYTENTHTVTETFDKISIDSDIADIKFLPAEEGVCKVECFEDTKGVHSVFTENGTLIIKLENTRRFYDFINITFSTPHITVYLPNEEYNSLCIETDAGDVTLPKNFTFQTVEIESDTADVICEAYITSSADIETDTGEITLSNISSDGVDFTAASGNIKIKTDTGDINLFDITCSNLSVESDTGDVVLKNVRASGKITAKNDTGNIRFDKSDAAELYAETSTGDVLGTLLFEKIFFAESDTGDISVPKTINGGKCEITTVTGDIKITLK